MNIFSDICYDSNTIVTIQHSVNKFQCQLGFFIVLLSKLVSFFKIECSNQQSCLLQNLIS